jgi:hypothetical protein
MHASATDISILCRVVCSLGREFDFELGLAGDDWGIRDVGYDGWSSDGANRLAAEVVLTAATLHRNTSVSTVKSARSIRDWVIIPTF